MADEKLIFPIGFDLEEGVRQVQKDWKKHQPEIQKTIDRNPLKLKLELSTKGVNISELKKYIGLSKEIAKANREIAKTRSANALAAQRESRQRVQEATELDQIKQKKAQAALAEERLRQAKERSAKTTHEQNVAYKTQGGYLQRLFQRMVAYASVTQAFSFIRNIREVTAQFELQRVALGSIIGDLNEANAMFEQIKAAAVKSPFQIKELVTYTKQLAAYKIETDELFETTQRLADISAGLDVGMERLVLAYGQIRATGYLRASEVRQLTEAGIPIVEELAKKMSQLRGETISAAEVMGLISERAISFGMVKEVFDDMTSAGGMFYKMQEKQAATLAGQWSNLRDSISIMYEEIGNTEIVNNAMKGMIGMVKSLAENWRTIGIVVGGTLGSFLAMRGVSKMLPNISNYAIRSAQATRQYKRAVDELRIAMQSGDRALIGSARSNLRYTIMMRNAEKASSAFMRSLKRLWATLVANPWTAILTAFAALASALYSAYENATRLDKELASIESRGALEGDQQVRNFERLALAIRESADGSAKQTEALEEMKRAYGEFLPSQDKSIINLVREKDGYNAVTQAIREKIALQMHEQKLNTIASEYGSRFGKWEGKLKESSFFKNFSKEEISLIISDIKNAVNDGLIATTNDIEDNMNKVRDIIHNITGSFISQDNLQRLFTGGTLYKGSVTELIKTQEAYNAQIQEVESSMESATGSLGKYTQAYKDFKEEMKDVTGTGEKFSFEWNESKTKAEIKAYNEFIGDLLAKEGIKFDIGEAIDFKGLYEALGDNYPQLKQVVSKIQGEYEKLVPKDLEKLIKEQFSTLATKYGASLDKLQHYFKSADQSTQDWVKTLKDAKTELDNQIFDAKKLDKDTTALEAQKQVIEAMITAWDNSEKTKKSAEQALKDELVVVEKIYKRYQDLRKLKSETDTQSILANEFKGVNLTTLSQAYSPKQMIAVYQKALAEAQRLGKKDLALEIQTKLGEFNVEEQQRELEQKLKDLSDKISRTKTAKEFFDRMLGMTGDKELSATLTMSVYGTTGDDLQKLMTKQVEEAFKDLPKGFDITKAMLGDGKFDYNLLESWIEKLPKDDRTLAQSIVDNWRKANADILTDLQKSYEDFMTYEERKTRVVERELANRKKIEESQYTKDEKDKLLRASREAEKKELGAIAIEEFKASDDWIKSFEDLENLATPTIERLMAKLKEFITLNKEALTPEQLKSLMGEYDKLYNGLITRNPIQAITDSIKEYKTAMQGVKLAQDALDAAKAMGDEDLVAFAERGLTDAFDDAQKATSKLQKGLSGLGDKFSQAQQFVSSFADTLGVSEDTQFGSFLNGISDALGGVSKAFAFAQLAVQLFDGSIKTMLASNPIGWILLAVSAIISAVQSIANARVKRIDQDIERIEDRLDSLSYAYDRLQKAQEKAFGNDYISNYERQLENLEAQQEAYLKQADLERSKGKKADEDKIKEYEKQARDTADAIKDMYGSLSEQFLGSDLVSTARDFASAWIDAYKEFSNTTDAMKAKFQDMIQNMVVESLLAKVMEKALEPVFTMIDEMQEGDFYSTSFWQRVMSTMQMATENGVVGAENVMAMLEQMGINLRGLGGEMTGISRDIATASEESILGLAAGINTQNFYISQVPTKLDTIIGLLRGDGAMPQGSTITLQDVMIAQNQFLSHLPTIAQHTAETVAECKMIVAETRRTADALERVIKPDGTRTTYKMNVVTTYQG